MPKVTSRLAFRMGRAGPTSISRLLGQERIGVVEYLAIAISSPQTAPSSFHGYLPSFKVELYPNYLLIPFLFLH
jgi:hypothetical protein